MSRPAKVCTVQGCINKHEAKGFCNKHYKRFHIHGRVDRVNRVDHAGTVRNSGHIDIQINGVTKGAHVWVAETALGRPLPKNAVVHHIDGNPQNNSPYNLVICLDESYHQLLHQRMRALDECGNADYRRCRVCKEWDDPVNMYEYRDGSSYRRYHRECENERIRNKRNKSKLIKENNYGG